MLTTDEKRKDANLDKVIKGPYLSDTVSCPAENFPQMWKIGSFFSSVLFQITLACFSYYCGDTVCMHPNR